MPSTTRLWGVGLVVDGLTGGTLAAHRCPPRWACVRLPPHCSRSWRWLSFAVGVWPDLPSSILCCSRLIRDGLIATSVGCTGNRMAFSLFAILMAVAYPRAGIRPAAGSSLVNAIDYRWSLSLVAARNLQALPLMGPIIHRREATA